MPNHITVTTELCAEDRARIDKTNELLASFNYLIETKLDKYLADQTPILTLHHDDITKKLQEAVNSAQDASKENTPTTNPIKEETPTQTEETKPTKAVSRTELGAKVREMMTKGFKEETKAIVKEYAPTVPGVPDDKVSECYERLVALEG